MAWARRSLGRHRQCPGRDHRGRRWLHAVAAAHRTAVWAAEHMIIVQNGSAAVVLELCLIAAASRHQRAIWRDYRLQPPGCNQKGLFQTAEFSALGPGAFT